MPVSGRLHVLGSLKYSTPRCFFPSSTCIIHQRMAASTRQQPQWQAPSAPGPEVQLPPLKIWNSLTRSKRQFVPIDWKHRKVSWYACGPTVYDDAHLGHARNYVTTDILRRIMRDFFKFDVQFVMNITDVDDKIILRGRQQHLLANFISQNSSADSKPLGTALEALQAYLSKNLPKVAHDTKPGDVKEELHKNYGDIILGGSLDGGTAGDREAKIKMHIKTVLAASEAISCLQNGRISLDDFYRSAQDIFLPYLDFIHGTSIDARDHTIFTKLTRRYEERFMEDVRALNCLDPDEVTRVTDYGPQIVDFVEKIQKNGFAYTTSDGSVYFDIESFEKANNNYARLEPWNRNDQDLQADGEGALTKKSTEKRSDADFALWKSSKPGEPSWPSPWGPGRPGWHIECSAMASDRLGAQIDIHSGGIDLAFPHHDNELAQSEAYWLGKDHQHQHQWVNYFLHMGHLSIQGSKMSKSLKNFTTIREALGRGDWTPRGLRIVFLLGGWKEGIEITDDLVKAGSAWEDKLNNFFFKVNDMLDRQTQELNPKGQESIKQEMIEALQKAKKETFEALCDSFSTPIAMTAISELVSALNSAENPQKAINNVREIAQWVTHMVNIFGLNGTATSETVSIGWSGVSIAEAARPYVYPLSEARDELRRKARSADGISAEDIRNASNVHVPADASGQKDSEIYAKVFETFIHHVRELESSPKLSKDVLQLCDRLRDVDLWEQGIYLEDRDGNQPALVRPVTRELLAARKEKEERERQKQKAKQDREKEAAARADKGRQSHLDVFRTAEYSAWDVDGVPTKDEKGEELPKSRAKKLRKDWERQKKLHEEWLKTNAS